MHWALRRDQLCDPCLCPDAPEDGGRCGDCPLDKLDAAQSSAFGPLVRRALDLRAALKLGFALTLDEIRADEFYTMVVLEEAQEQLERERLDQRQ